MNGEFQRIARRDEMEAFLNEQHKEREENNIKGKTRDLLKKIGAIKGMYYLKWDRCQASVISSFLSHLNTNLKQWTLKPLAHHSSWTVHVLVLRQISFI